MKKMLALLCVIALLGALYVPVAAASARVPVVADVPDDWTGVYLYAWGQSEEATWPGVPMVEIDGWYVAYMNTDNANVIINNGAGIQTGDLAVQTGMPVYVTANDPSNATVTYTLPIEVPEEDALPKSQMDTIYARVPEDWTGVHLYAWNGAGSNAGWPGAPMTQSENGLWVAELNPGYTNVIIAQSGGYQTVDLSYNGGDCWIFLSEEAGADGKFTAELFYKDPDKEAAEAYLVGEGTATYATDADAWNAEKVTFVPADDGIVTAEIIECTPGFYLDVYEDGEWVEEHFDSTAKKISIAVTAGKTYEFLFSSAAIYSPTMFEMKAGSVTYKVTADVEAGEPNQGEGGDDPIPGGENSEENPQLIGAFFGNYIAAGQTMWFVFDNYDHMVQDGVYSQMLNISAGVPYSATYRGMDIPVDAEGFVSYEMMDMTYQGKYVFSVTNCGSEQSFFTIEVKDRPAYTVSEIALVLGDNQLFPDSEFSNTLYEFIPETTGIYTFTVSGSTIGNWGTVFNPQDYTGTNASDLQWTCTAEGQSILIGVAQSDEAVLTIERTGDYVAEDVVPPTLYQNTYRFDYQLPENPELVSIDVLDDKADVAVLDKDGIYRYGSEYGCLMVADLSKFPVNLEDAYINGQLRAYLYNDSGEVIAKNDYNEAIYEYLEAGLVPVTEELATMLKQLGDHHGWWRAEGFVFEGEAPEDASTAWMVACSYIKGSELTPEEDNGGNQNGSGNQTGSGDQTDTESNPKTADISMAWAMAAALMAGTCLMVMKKKESFFLN